MGPDDWEGEAYCVKCKCRVHTTGYIEEVNGRRFAKGICPVCGTKVTRILGAPSTDVSPSQSEDTDILDQRSGYGTPAENHRRIAALWSAYLGFTVEPWQVAWCMVLVKASRSVNSPDNPDHYLDAKGYVDIAEECYREALREHHS